MKGFFAIILLICLTLPIFAFAQNQLPAVPQNINDVKNLGEKAIETGQNQGPSIVTKVWQDDFLPVWQTTLGWLEIHIWDYRVKPWLQNLWDETLQILKIEVKKRTPGAENKLKEETSQAQKEAPKVGESLWNKFLGIIK